MVQQQLVVAAVAALAISWASARPLGVSLVYAGSLHSCLIMIDGKTVCFGTGANGRLGTESTMNVGDSEANDLGHGIVKLPAGRTAVKLALGAGHTCAVLDNGQAVCFGSELGGRLGTGRQTDVGDSPTNGLSNGIVKLPANCTAVSIATGDGHSCVLLHDGKALCFGTGPEGQLGTESTDSVFASPTTDLGAGFVKLPHDRSAIAISTSNDHTCALLDNGKAVCFGDGQYGRLGTESETNVGDSADHDLSKGIVKLPSGHTAIDISAGPFHTCVVLSDGRALCFGQGASYKLGTGSLANVGDSSTNDLSKGIVKLPANRTAVTISAGYAHTCVVLDNGQAVCFGDGGDGRLGTESQLRVGDSATDDLSDGIVKVPLNRTVVSISAGLFHTCAVLDNQQAVCFGNGGSGRLGTLSESNVGHNPESDLSKGIVQLPTPLPTPTATSSSTSTTSPTSSVSPSSAVSPSETPSSSVTPSVTATTSASSSVTPSSTSTPTTSPSPSPTGTSTPSVTASPTSSSSSTPSGSPTSSFVPVTNSGSPSPSASASAPAAELDGAALETSSDTASFSAGPAAAVALLAVAAVSGAAYAMHRRRSARFRGTARPVPAAATV